MLTNYDSGRDLTTAVGPFAPALEYMIDAAQRSVLFWDVMRQRGNHTASI